MKGKKFFSFAAALVLLLSASVPALAASGGKKAVKISAVAKLPTVRVVVPSTGGAIVNPYRLTANINTVSKSEQIIYLARALWSRSDVPLDVTTTVSATIPSSSKAKLESSSARNLSTKSAYMYLEIKKFDVTAGRIDENGYLKDDLEEINWSGSEKTVLENGKEKTVPGGEKWRLPPLDKEGNPGAYIAYRFAGDAAENPDTNWTNSDSVTLSVAFTFTAVPFDEYDG